MLAHQRIQRAVLTFVVVVLAVATLSGVADAKKSRWHKRPNMPRGWVWPPSEEMKAEGEACLARLTELGVKWEHAKETRKIATPIYVPDMQFGPVKLVSLFKKGPHVMDCNFAKAMAESGGPAMAKLGVKEIVFSSIYNYRNVADMKALSRHALGLAMDVYRFRTEDGKEHVVLGGYRKSDTLKAIEKTVNATGAYRMLLTPGNDRDHRDHFHFEARTAGDRVETPPPRHVS